MSHPTCSRSHLLLIYVLYYVDLSRLQLGPILGHERENKRQKSPAPSRSQLCVLRRSRWDQRHRRPLPIASLLCPQLRLPAAGPKSTTNMLLIGCVIYFTPLLALPYWLLSMSRLHSFSRNSHIAMKKHGWKWLRAAENHRLARYTPHYA